MIQVVERVRVSDVVHKNTSIGASIETDPEGLEPRQHTSLSQSKERTDLAGESSRFTSLGRQCPIFGGHTALSRPSTVMSLQPPSTKNRHQSSPCIGQ